MQVRTRFAPSPTGYLHIGSLRTALYCYLWAKKEKGRYILRIEDTDQARYVEGSTENLISVLERCHIIHDEGPVLEDHTLRQIGDYGPYFQSERLAIYQKFVQQLLSEGKAYYCFCTKERLESLREEQISQGLTPKYDSKCSHLSDEEVKSNLDAGLPYVIRMKLPENREVIFDDLVRGTVSINTNDMDEQVLIKADGFPTYHFAVVVDDHLMEITHVIRGEEWLVSTPKHLLLFEAFGWNAPRYVHLPTVLNTNKKKLSKRDGSASVEDYLKKGYIPEALTNYIAMLGWSAPDGREIFSMNEIIDEFSLDRIHKSGAVFDVEKLNWVNSQYIKAMDDEELAYDLREYLGDISGLDTNDHIKMLYAAQCLKDRISYFEQAKDEMNAILGVYSLSECQEAQEAKSFDTNQTLYESAIEKIEALNELTPENLTDLFKFLQKEKGIKGKNLYMGLRIGLTGEVHGADIKLVMCIIGKNMVLERLKNML